MNAAKKRGHISEKLITTDYLMEILGVGRTRATRIGTRIGARVQIGHRVYWNVDKVKEYIENTRAVRNSRTEV